MIVVHGTSPRSLVCCNVKTLQFVKHQCMSSRPLPQHQHHHSVPSTRRRSVSQITWIFCKNNTVSSPCNLHGNRVLKNWIDMYFSYIDLFLDRSSRRSSACQMKTSYCSLHFLLNPLNADLPFDTHLFTAWMKLDNAQATYILIKKKTHFNL
jgi:hypothetical protein